MTGENPQRKPYPQEFTVGKLIVLEEIEGAEGADILSTGITVGKVLTADGDDTSSWQDLPASLSYGEGTSFPGSPSSGDIFARSDLHQLFIYSGGASMWIPIQAILVYNNTGGPLAKSTPVRVDGYNATVHLPEVVKSTADTVHNCHVLGLVVENIADGTAGYVVYWGDIIDGIDTSTPGYNVGDHLYVGVSGGLTNVQPDVMSQVAQVLKVGTTDGIIQVAVHHPQISDTIVRTATNGAISSTAGNTTWGVADVSNKFVRYSQKGTGPTTVASHLYFEFPLPDECEEILDVQVITRRTGTIPGVYTFTVSKNGTADTAINGVDIEPVAINTFETFNFTPAQVHSGGDLIRVDIAPDLSGASTGVQAQWAELVIKYRRKV